MVNINAGGILFNRINIPEQICTKEKFMQRIAESKNNELKDLHIDGVAIDGNDGNDVNSFRLFA